MDADEIARVLAQVARDDEINCTGPGEVGCKGRTGWHSWTEHRAHVAQSQAELLAPLVEQARQEGAREALTAAADGLDPRILDGVVDMKTSAFRQGAVAAWAGVERWLRDRAERAARTPGSGTAGGGS